MNGKRFILKSISFPKMTVELFDNMEAKHLTLSIYELVDLLNNVSRQEYSLLKFKDEINDKIDKIMGESNE